MFINYINAMVYGTSFGKTESYGKDGKELSLLEQLDLIVTYVALNAFQDGYCDTQSIAITFVASFTLVVVGFGCLQAVVLSTTIGTAYYIGKRVICGKNNGPYTLNH